MRKHIDFSIFKLSTISTKLPKVEPFCLTDISWNFHVLHCRSLDLAKWLGNYNSKHCEKRSQTTYCEWKIYEQKIKKKVKQININFEYVQYISSPKRLVWINLNKISFCRTWNKANKTSSYTSERTNATRICISNKYE